MKKTLILAIFLTGLAWQSFGQKAETPMTKQDYLDKSKSQKKTGFILLGAGAGSAILGGILMSSNFCIFGCTSSQDIAFGTGAGLVVAGGISMIASIPVLISGGVNANKAAELTLYSQPIDLPQHANSGSKSFPALKISIPF